MRNVVQKVFVVVIALMSTTIMAQEVTGEISGTIGSDEHAWVTMVMDTEDGPRSTATWGLRMGRLFTLTMQGHPEPSFQVEGAIALVVSSMAGIPDECPCTFDGVEIYYWTSSSSVSDVYTSADNTLVLTNVERLDDATIRVLGTFSGTLSFQASPSSNPDPNRALEVQGTLDVHAIQPPETGR